MIFSPRVCSSEIYEKNPNISWQVIEGKTVVIDSIEGELVHFNDLGALLWQKLTGRHSLEEILADLHREWDVPFKTLEKDMAQFIRQLCQMELIQKVSEES